MNHITDDDNDVESDNDADEDADDVADDVPFMKPAPDVDADTSSVGT